VSRRHRCPGEQPSGPRRRERDELLGRRAPFANSAIIVEVAIGDLDGTDPLAGRAVPGRIEARAFRLAGGDYKAPGQRVEDFLAGRPSTIFRASAFRWVHAGRPGEILRRDRRRMVEAIRHFDRRLPGLSPVPRACCSRPRRARPRRCGSIATSGRVTVRCAG
jgi:hypothetical protein